MNELFFTYSKPGLKRMWINQPSTLQPFHHMHGVNVLAYCEYGNTMKAYLLSGDVVSMQIQKTCLSDGWCK